MASDLPCKDTATTAGERRTNGGHTTTSGGLGHPAGPLGGPGSIAIGLNLTSSIGRPPGRDLPPQGRWIHADQTRSDPSEKLPERRAGDADHRHPTAAGGHVGNLAPDTSADSALVTPRAPPIPPRTISVDRLPERPHRTLKAPHPITAHANCPSRREVRRILKRAHARRSSRARNQNSSTTKSAAEPAPGRTAGPQRGPTGPPSTGTRLDHRERSRAGRACAAEPAAPSLPAPTSTDRRPDRPGCDG